MTTAALALLGRVIDEADAGQLPVLIAEWEGAPDHRRWIARALRLDLPVLAARPELVVPCVLRRCAWLGDEAWFYRTRPEPPDDARALRELAAAWQAEWELGNRYLRALRPPEVPLDGGAIEEYRTAEQGALWLTDDAIGVGAAVAWERGSGRKIASPYREPPLPPWQLDHKRSTEGQAWLVSSGGDRRIALAPEQEPWMLHELDDQLALLVTRVFDGDDFAYSYHLVRPAAGATLWSNPGHPARAIRTADRLYVLDRSVTVHDLATGAIVAEWAVDGRELAVCASGHFATRRDHVIRVWDPARVPRDPHELASTFSWTQLSPDESQLITGYVLCDARTGRYIGVVDLRGVGGWLEGGPPMNCRRLCDGRLVEILPFGLTAWTTRPAIAAAVERRGTDASIGDAVAFDRTGQLLAVWERRRDRVLRVSVIDGAIEVFSYPADLGDGFQYELGFSPDSTRLWWRAADGTHRIAMLATGEVRALAPGEPLPAEPGSIAATVRDGLLVADELAIPIDAPDAIASRDGRIFAAWNAHYAVAGARVIDLLTSEG